MQSLTGFPIHSLSLSDSSPNTETSIALTCLANAFTYSGTVHSTVQCWKSLPWTIALISSSVCPCITDDTMKTALVSDSLPH